VNLLRTFVLSRNVDHPRALDVGVALIRRPLRAATVKFLNFKEVAQAGLAHL
jgi:hypothetical protein